MFCAITLAVSGIFAPALSWSAASATGTTPQTITFAHIPDVTMLDPALTVTASASSGGGVTFQSLTKTVCTTSGVNQQIVSPLAPGVCTIEADQAGDDTFAPASTQQSFTITAAAQTISFAPLPNVALGIAVVFVFATATSGHTVTFTTTTPSVCTTDTTNGKINLEAAGTCTVQADQAGNSLYAAAPSVTQSFGVGKAAQAITFPTILDHSILDTPVTVSASSVSLLPVTFTVPTTTSVCSASGTSGATIVLKAAGTCSVQADQAGDSGFDAAASITRSFNVTPAAQSISFAPLSAKSVTDLPFTVAAIASSGLPVVFSTTATPTICSTSATNGSTITLLAAGTCTVKADQAGNSTYAPAQAAFQGFPVSKVDQTITFGPVTDHSITQTPVAVTATASSAMAVTFTSTTPGFCTASGSSITLVAIGSCTVEADQAGNATYNAASPVQQTFNVTAVAKVDQTITFSALPQVAVSATTTAGATASSGLAVTFTTTTPTVCTATGTNGATITRLTAGTCTIQADQAGNAAFNPAPPVTQTLGVAKTSQTITFPVLANLSVGHAPITVAATASSTLAVMFTTTTPTVCSASGTNGAVINIVTAGTCTVEAAQSR